jgi:hypothetical protein
MLYGSHTHRAVLCDVPMRGPALGSSAPQSRAHVPSSVNNV